MQVDAAKVLHAEVRDVIGRYSNIKSKHDPEKVLEKSSVFVGEARVPLAETLPGFMTRTSNTFGADNSDGGENSTVKREFVLARRHGGDLVSGYITLSFEWTITAASLLKQKLRVLEQVLTTRNEILSILAPRPIERTEISHNLTGSRGPGALARTSNAGSFDECKSRRADGVLPSIHRVLHVFMPTFRLSVLPMQNPCTTPVLSIVLTNRTLL